MFGCEDTGGIRGKEAMYMQTRTKECSMTRKSIATSHGQIWHVSLTRERAANSLRQTISNEVTYHVQLYIHVHHIMQLELEYLPL